MSNTSKRRGALGCCIAAVILLTALFIFPGRIAASLRDDVTALVDDVIRAVKDSDFDLAGSLVRAIKVRYDDVSVYMQLFFDHEDLDELKASTAAAKRLIEQQDDSQVMVELESIRNIVVYLSEIETLKLTNLL